MIKVRLLHQHKYNIRRKPEMGIRVKNKTVYLYDPDKAEEYIELAKDWAIKMDGKVVENEQEIDYSSKYYANKSKQSSDSAEASAESASASATTATQKAQDADASSNEATRQAGLAANSATSSATSAATATTQAGIATTQAGISTQKATDAANSAVAAEISRTNARSAAESSISARNESIRAKNDSETSATNAASSAVVSETNADLSKQWAVGEPTEPSGGSAKYWAGQAAQGQIQSDWTQTDTTEKDFIKNKPAIVNNTSSTSTTDVLSANMGRDLQLQINNFVKLARFLSYWDCTTGLPITNPQTIPYEYKTGDFYIVRTVGETNYRPNGSQYTGSASTTLETESVQEKNLYFYDGSSWMLISSGTNISVDEKSITYNDDNELQTVGVIDQNNTSTALKQWSGTLAEYNAIATKDSDTIYNITDDNTAEAFDAYSKAETDLLLAQKQNTGVSYTKAETDTKILDMLKLVYPVNSMYLSTASTCPLQALFGTWQNVGTSLLTNVTGSSSVPVKGNGKAMTWTCGSSGEGACACNGTSGTWAQRNTVGSNYNVGDTLVCNSVLVVDKAMGLSQTASRSGIIADISGSLTKSSLTVNIFKRTA